MSRTPLLLAAVFAASGAMAEEPRLEPLPEIPPPPGMVDTEVVPDVRITQRGGEQVEEFRIKGRLYMIRVTGPNTRPYYLVDERGDGQLKRYDDLSPNLMVPMWMIPMK